MSGFFDSFKNKVVSSVYDAAEDCPKETKIDDKIALGVLLWVVAEADGKFLPREESTIGDILKKNKKVTDQEIQLVLASVKEAAKERIDLYAFTSEVSKNIEYSLKISIIEDLFRVACSDQDLDDSETETIRKISGLFHLSHKDFIDAKIRVKKEFDLDTAGF